jgi:hypothetical protein
MTQHKKTASWIISLITFFSLATEAKLYKYSELQIKDYDEMLKLVKEHVANSSKKDSSDQQAVDELREALLLILARPNQDNMLAKLMPDVRKELSGFNAFEDSLASLTQEAIRGLSNDKLPTVNRSTYMFVLENILAEFKPEVKEKAEIRKIFETIRDAKLKLPKDVTKDLRLRSMLKVESPSERAKRILKQLIPEKK